MNKAVLAHPHGPPFATHATQTLLDTPFAVDVVSTLAFERGSSWQRRGLPRCWIPAGASIHRCFARECIRLAALRAGLPRLFGIRSQSLTDFVYRGFSIGAAKRVESDTTLVYGYEDGSLELFEAAVKVGARCIYDLPIMYWGLHNNL